MSFPWLQERVDAQGLDGWWLPCLHHLFRDVLRYHNVRTPLYVLFRPMHLVYFVDKNRYPWLWDGAAEDFSYPQFNQGVTARWQEAQILGCADLLDAARAQIAECLSSGRIPIIHLEWFHVPFTTHFGKLRGNLHAVAVLDYQSADDSFFIVDRTALPLTRGGFEKDRGWIQVESLRTAIQEDFAWLDYHIDSPKRPWRKELQTLLYDSVVFMRGGNKFTTSHSDHGFQAIHGFAHFIETLQNDELETTRISTILRWHLPPCIRKFVIGQRQVLNVVLGEFEDELGPFIASARESLFKSIVLWDQLATLLVRLGFERQTNHKVAIVRHIEGLEKEERVLSEILETIATVL
jgi:hypothetical protein